MSPKVKIGFWILLVVIGVFLLLRLGEKLLNPFLEGGAEIAEPQTNSSGALASGDKAPYFELSDLAGNRVHLSDFANTPLLITFWATSASDAEDQIRILDDYKANHPHALFQILTVNIEEDRSVAGAFIRRGKYAVPVALDTTGNTGKTYHIATLPTSFFVDGNGIIQAISIGIMSQKMIEDNSERIIGAMGI